jgi:CheY-like chemotaxis protein
MSEELQNLFRIIHGKIRAGFLPPDKPHALARELRRRLSEPPRIWGKSPSFAHARMGENIAMQPCRENMSTLPAKLRIAVIDDEHIVADTLVEILNLHGYEAKAHYSGESVLADLEQFHPHVVLSDVRMERIDGIETAIRIRAVQPGCRIILFTASPVRRRIYERIRDLGFEFLERPLHPSEVLALLRGGSQGTQAIARDDLRMRTSTAEADHAAGRRMLNADPLPG